jgi:signal transduction histidine kinase
MKSLLAPLSRLSLLWKILLSTSIALTLLFLVTGWVVQDQFARIASVAVEEEVQQGFEAYKSLWRARAAELSSVCLVMSRMSDVRAAFRTGDQATIADTAGEIWSKISKQDAFFLVTDPRGAVLARLGESAAMPGSFLSEVPRAFSRFPGQASGFVNQGGQLYQIVITPVYVDSSGGAALLNVLVAGYTVNSKLAATLKQATGGSDFVFTVGGQTAATTLSGPVHAADFREVTAPLTDVEDLYIGELHILRSWESARRRISTLGQRMILVWLLAVLVGLATTYALAKRILRPVRALDQAAVEIGRGNYTVRIENQGEDELGRLSATFNVMAASIHAAREDLISQERISTIGRLSTSIVHDLRNPLAAIYAGAEMLVDADLPPAQVKRLAQNIYRSSRHVQELLSELTDVTRGRTQSAEICRLDEVVSAAREILATQARAQKVEIQTVLPPDLELPLERSRMERVFENLFSNAIEAMPGGGVISVTTDVTAQDVKVIVDDTGPGVDQKISSHLFEPFVTAGKKNGIGLGLALSRKTVLDHGGDMWSEQRPGLGARFVVRLPRG